MGIQPRQSYGEKEVRYRYEGNGRRLFPCETSLALEKEGSPTSRRSDTQWLDEANVIEALKAITVPRRKSKKVKRKK